MSTKDVQTAPYDEDTRNGELCYVKLQVEINMGGGLSLVWNSDTVNGCQTQLLRLVKSVRGENVAGVIGEDQRKNPSRVIWVHLSLESGNAICAKEAGR